MEITDIDEGLVWMDPDEGIYIKENCLRVTIRHSRLQKRPSELQLKLKLLGDNNVVEARFGKDKWEPLDEKFVIESSRLRRTAYDWAQKLRDIDKNNDPVTYLRRMAQAQIINKSLDPPPVCLAPADRGGQQVRRRGGPGKRILGGFEKHWASGGVSVY